MRNKPVIIPVPNHDFDPTEAAVPWKIVKSAGFDVVFATPDGKPAHGDAMMLSGEGLDPWGWIPVLKKIRMGSNQIFCSLLGPGLLSYLYGKCR